MTSSTSQVEGNDASAEYLETIALLQEEIARLENELLAREESCQSTVADGRSSDDEVAPGYLALQGEKARLAAELASRDETITLLLDQLRLVEEAEATSRAEWEQLAQWVTEVEERVERQSREEGSSGEERSSQDEMIAVARRQADDTRSLLDRERNGWHEKQRDLEAQIEQLQALLARQSAREASRGEAGAGCQSDAAKALALLEVENRRLRQAIKKLEETSRSESQVLGERLGVAERELAAARKAHDAVEDERARERREFEIAVASLRSQAARASVAAYEINGHGASSAAAGDGSSALDADIRIRAFRQHLKEIHSHEAEVRNSNRLGARLSRLWTRTVPK
jgi:hypothetical protein